MSQNLNTVKEKAKQRAKSVPDRGDSQNELNNHFEGSFWLLCREHSIVEGKGGNRETIAIAS